MDVRAAASVGRGPADIGHGLRPTGLRAVEGNTPRSLHVCIAAHQRAIHHQRTNALSFPFRLVFSDLGGAVQQGDKFRIVKVTGGVLQVQRLLHIPAADPQEKIRGVHSIHHLIAIGQSRLQLQILRNRPARMVRIERRGADHSLHGEQVGDQVQPAVLVQGIPNQNILRLQVRVLGHIGVQVQQQPLADKGKR